MRPKKETFKADLFSYCTHGCLLHLLKTRLKMLFFLQSRLVQTRPMQHCLFAVNKCHWAVNRTDVPFFGSPSWGQQPSPPKTDVPTREALMSSSLLFFSSMMIPQLVSSSSMTGPSPKSPQSKSPVALLGLLSLPFLLHLLHLKELQKDGIMFFSLHLAKFHEFYEEKVDKKKSVTRKKNCLRK